MAPYGIPTLLEEYCPGTRAWMYEAVFTWLDTAPQEAGGSSGSSDEPGRRMFALFAEAGMGKSVFSAAMRTKLGVRTNKDSSVIMVGGWLGDLLVCWSVAWSINESTWLHIK